MLRKEAEARPAAAAEVIRALAPILAAPPAYERRFADAFAVGPLVLTVSVGDLATTQATVLVHAAAPGMAMDTEVAASLRRRGGALIEQQARANAPAGIGDVVWTSAGLLDAQWVAHAVAAVDGASFLGRCMLIALIDAEIRSAASVALPALGTDGGSVPMPLAAKRILDAIRTFASLGPTRVRTIRLVLPDVHAREQWHMVLASMMAS